LRAWKPIRDALNSYWDIYLGGAIIFYVIAKVAILAIIDDGRGDGVYWPWEQTPAEQQRIKRHYQDLRRQLLGTEDV
jgi:hypothetical protein|tara:strand:+ start:355 stop:585 length:231 start_codon:yes stop_codon:yes gene_type:complete